ncbi:hypothetical protein [Granulicella arctica]|uniref:Uncharacterized protein n=1 Tax=Granulicella arctica TaxID=940613 RepID=A0A7Y9PGG0_9BACT|nr:hypothetical protein [Granulicella arctica]NYF79274.1 hypothetical protein [Granulicella arctica]
MQSLDIHSFSYSDRSHTLLSLTDSLTDSGAWITDRSTISPSLTELRFEIQLHCVLNLYTALITTGLELTRAAHHTMTELWTCFNNLDTRFSDVIVVRLEINFLEDVTLHSLLSSARALA